MSGYDSAADPAPAADGAAHGSLMACGCAVGSQNELGLGQPGFVVSPAAVVEAEEWTEE